VPVPEEQLPVLLPDMKNYEPSGTGRSPLANAPEFVNTICPKCGGPAERETDTLDGFACSSWYFLRFASPHYDRGPFDPPQVDYWLPVDLYVGGAEHAVMHLLYARMWTKVMFDAGLVKFKEPFAVLRNQGMIWAADGQKMSKSKGNVVTPDAMVKSTVPTRCGCGNSSWARSRNRPTGTRRACSPPRDISPACGMRCAVLSRPEVP